VANARAEWLRGSGVRSTPIAALLDEAVQRLAAAGIDSARLDARVLLGHVLGVEAARLTMLHDQVVSDDERRRFDELVARRARRAPVAYLTGAREFWSLSFAVDRHTLIPRPDSETLVEAALARRPDRGSALRLLDLGAGSGCLLLAILSERPAWCGVGVDRDVDALRVARRNAAALGMAARTAWVVADWAAGLAGSFDLIVSNPPYIPSGEIAALAPDVRDFEPRAALDGGPDGLAAYRDLALLPAALLRPGGRFLVEIGAGQRIEITRIFAAHGWLLANTNTDLGGHERCVEFARGGGAML
jgi:release factor glutamine methyltransferase